MIDPQFFHSTLIEHDINFFTGVPDSLLADFGAYLQENENHHYIAANEGNAIALASGSYLATGKPGLVYLQNSGQGNAINPLISLADPSVYGIPMLLVIGWRGEPGKKDEPQHMRQGEVTIPIFDALGVPWAVLPDDESDLKSFISEMVTTAADREMPVAIIVRKGTFSSYEVALDTHDDQLISRENAVAAAAQALGSEALVIATTGKISRELYSYRYAEGQNDSNDFLTVGSMGHASQIALGVALEKPERMVYCFDGDGAAIMQMGGMATISASGCHNFTHVVFNNRSHDSVGGLPTAAADIQLSAVAKACGYNSAVQVDTIESLKRMISKEEVGPRFIEVMVSKGSRENLPRPASIPKERKIRFMDRLKETL